MSKGEMTKPSPLTITAVSPDGIATIRIANGTGADCECLPAETAGGGFARTVVETLPTVNESAIKSVTFANSERHTDGGQVIGKCENCGGMMIVKRTTGAKRKRYCSDSCRGEAFRSRQVI